MPSMSLMPVSMDNWAVKRRGRKRKMSLTPYSAKPFLNPPNKMKKSSNRRAPGFECTPFVLLNRRVEADSIHSCGVCAQQNPYFDNIHRVLKSLNRRRCSSLSLCGEKMDVSLCGITTLLRAWSKGNDQALDRLTSLVYAELRRLARSHMVRENPDHILQSTALISEIYLHLDDFRQTDWQSRAQFFGVCSLLMRHTLAGYARSRLYLKRGGEARQVSFDEDLEIPDRDTGSLLIALDDALRDLAVFDERMSQVVQLRFFGGFSVIETAEALNIPKRTVEREWTSAKLWLMREIDRGAQSEK